MTIVKTLVHTPKNVNLSLPEYRSAVYASSTWDDPGFEADKAVDGNNATRWASEDGHLSNPVSLTVLFDNTYDFNKVLMNAWNLDNRIASYELQYLKKDGDPDNDSDWVKFAESNNNMPNHETDFEIDFENISGDGVRVIMTKNEPSFNAISLYKFEIYNWQMYGGINKKDTGVNLTGSTYRKSVEASSTWNDPGFEADKAVDGNNATRWTSSENGSADNTTTLTVLFNNTFNFNNIMINAWNLDGRIESYEMQYLKKGGDPDEDSDWETFAEGVGNVLVHETDFQINLDTLYGDGIRVIMTKKAPSFNAISLYEFQVRYQ